MRSRPPLRAASSTPSHGLTAISPRPTARRQTARKGRSEHLTVDGLRPLPANLSASLETSGR